jgi:uroporphyrin-III C-methyltransferase
MLRRVLRTVNNQKILRYAHLVLLDISIFEDDARSRNVFMNSSQAISTLGKVFFVGAGPGAVDLLTLRAARLLGEADVVLYDALVGKEVLDLAPQAKKLSVGKRCGRRSLNQNAINLLLVDAAWSFRRVVRLKGGDPAVFGRLHEELFALDSAGISYDVVPGITSALAAAAQLGVSLTERGVARSVTFATPAVGNGQISGSDWAHADPSSTLCLYMAGGEFGACARRLIAQGWAAGTPVRAVRDVSEAASDVWVGTLAQAPSRLLGPVTVLIGMALLSLHSKMRTSLSSEVQHADHHIATSPS